MDIRSVTLLCSADYSPEDATAALAAARGAFAVPVQSARVALPPFPDWWPDDDAPAAFVRRWQAAGADYVSFGPVRLAHDAAWLDRLPDFLGAAGGGFAAAEIADPAGRIDPQRCRRVASVIRRASRLRDDGFANLYLTAIANCPPGSPFFPVAYHDGGPPVLALAVESADLAVSAFAGAATLGEARARLIAAVEGAAAELADAGRALADAQGLAFGGIDFSLAPFPSDDKSLGGALEALGVTLGAPGALFAAALITEALQTADFPRCGFSGLMLPVLEDNVLARRAADGEVTVSDLLAYAAVCGVGLDTIPLAGDVPVDALAGILLDVAALAARLDKPLTARLMPLPGLAAGDLVTFAFPYFADSGVIGVGGAITGLLRDGAPLALAPYHTGRA